MIKSFLHLLTVVSTVLAATQTFPLVPTSVAMWIPVASGIVSAVLHFWPASVQ